MWEKIYINLKGLYNFERPKNLGKSEAPKKKRTDIYGYRKGCIIAIMNQAPKP